MKQLDSFEVIRATVEAEVNAPGVLTISSALAGDGSASVAAGMARSLAAAGYRVLAIDAGPAAESLATKLGASESPIVTVAAAAQRLNEHVRQTAARCDLLVLGDASGNAPSAVSIAEVYAAARTQYDYTIVGALAVTGGGASFARCADGVLLAVREGRGVVPADRDAVTVLDRIRARFLGVVATAGAAKHDEARADGEADHLTDRIGRIAGSARARFFDAFTFGRKSQGATVAGTVTPD